MKLFTAIYQKEQFFRAGINFENGFSWLLLKKRLKVLPGMFLYSFPKTSENILDWLSLNWLEYYYINLCFFMLRFITRLQMKHHTKLPIEGDQYYL